MNYKLTPQTKNIITGALFFAIFGVIYFAWQQEWLIFNYPCRAVYNDNNSQLINKPVYIWYKQTGTWHSEKTDVIWSSTRPAENAQRLIQRTLGVLREQHALKKPVTVRLALTDYTGKELLIFFDKSPLDQTLPVHEKLAIINSILKTLHENGVPFTHARFFVGEQAIEDTHLDFDQPWPIEGFA